MGLQTVTWIAAGELLHRDSLGSEQLIRPGSSATSAPGAVSTASMWQAPPAPCCWAGCEPLVLRYHSPQPGGLTVPVTARGSTADLVWPAS
jgi:hypothetical protein